MATAPLRKITKRETIKSDRTKISTRGRMFSMRWEPLKERLMLECGHEVLRYHAYAPHSQVRCKQCIGEQDKGVNGCWDRSSESRAWNKTSAG
jgi:hypothetical protein